MCLLRGGRGEETDPDPPWERVPAPAGIDGVAPFNLRYDQRDAGAAEEVSHGGVYRDRVPIPRPLPLGEDPDNLAPLKRSE